MLIAKTLDFFDKSKDIRL